MLIPHPNSNMWPVEENVIHHHMPDEHFAHNPMELY